MSNNSGAHPNRVRFSHVLVKKKFNTVELDLNAYFVLFCVSSLVSTWQQMSSLKVSSGSSSSSGSINRRSFSRRRFGQQGRQWQRGKRSIFLVDHDQLVVAHVSLDHFGSRLRFTPVAATAGGRFAEGQFGRETFQFQVQVELTELIVDQDGLIDTFERNQIRIQHFLDGPLVHLVPVDEILRLADVVQPGWIRTSLGPDHIVRAAIPNHLAGIALFNAVALGRIIRLQKARIKAGKTGLVHVVAVVPQHGERLGSAAASAGVPHLDPLVQVQLEVVVHVRGYRRAGLFR